MKAKITLVGNKKDGFVVTVYLPKEWISEFKTHHKFGVLGEHLSSNWRGAMHPTPEPLRTANFLTLDEANVAFDRAKDEIRAGLEFLRSVVLVEKTVEIEL